ncbi:MAG: hypothetical protein AAFN93_08895 [Bacteroidota bacterium]
MERNKVELILCTFIGCVGLAVLFLGVVRDNELVINLGSATSTLFPIFGLFRLLD